MYLAAAVAVSKDFDDAQQCNCIMHILNLCIRYATGLKENTQHGQIITPGKYYSNCCENSMNKVRIKIIRIGGEFTEGAKLIDKLRALAVYFSHPQRRQRLHQVKLQLDLPDADARVEAPTRCAYVVNLLQRSISNYQAYQMYVYGSVGLSS